MTNLSSTEDFSHLLSTPTMNPNMLNNTDQMAALDVYNSTPSNWTSDILTTSATIVAETTTLDVYNSTQSNWTSDILTTTASIAAETAALDVYNSTQSNWTSDILTTSASIVEETTALDIYNSTPSNWTSDIFTTSASIVDDYKLPLAALWVYFTVRIIWGGLSVFGNSLTILVVAKFERLQTCTNYLICNLAANDMMAGVVVPLVIIHDLFPDSWFYVPTCLYEKTLTLLITGGNLATILYLSIDRFIYIVYPLRYYQLVTPGRVLFVLVISWTFAFVTIPTMMFAANHLKVGMTCTYYVFLDDWVVDYFLFPLFAFYIITTNGLHIAIARIAHRQAQAIAAQQHPYDTMETAINQSTRKIRMTLVTVLGVYLLAIMPQFITAWVIMENKKLVPLQKFTNCVFWANSWVNPLIYAWRLKDFRIGFKKLLTGKGSFNEVP